MLIDKLSGFQKTFFILNFKFLYRGLIVACLPFIALMTGCTAPNYIWPAYDKITLHANLNVNPDDNQRPSPIQVKVFELSARTTFDNLDFQSLFNNGGTLLSDELISEKTFFIQPNETISHTIELNKESTHIAIVAAYRKIDSARWKHIYPIKFYGYYKHTIDLTSEAIEVRKSERSNKSEEGKRREKTKTARKDRHGKNTTTTSESPEQQKTSPNQSELQKPTTQEEPKIPHEVDETTPSTEKDSYQKKIHQVWST